MGKNARLRKEKIEQEKKGRQRFIKKNFQQKNPWLFFWRKFEFWVYLVCLVAICIYPFVPKFSIYQSDDGTQFGSSTRATLETSMGDIEIVLYDKDAPKTVDNFVKLANQNFYTQLLWHRVIRGFMIQTGDPLGDGTGGPGYQFDDEINSHKIEAGTVAMANSGENTNGSQFFIVTDEAQPHLDGKHTVFGYVIGGMEIVRQIAEVPTDENDKPLTPIYLNQVKIIK